MQKSALAIVSVATLVALLTGCSSTPAGPVRSYKIVASDSGKGGCGGTLTMPEPTDWTKSDLKSLPIAVRASCVTKAFVMQSDSSTKWSVAGVWHTPASGSGISVQDATIDGKSGTYISDTKDEAHGQHIYGFFTIIGDYAVGVDWQVPVIYAKQPGAREKYAALFKQMTITVAKK